MSSFLTLEAVALATPSGHPLFSNLSLNVGRECVGVVGRNGAGKSTLLRAIVGGVALQSGTITLSGTAGMLEQVVTPGDESAAVALGVSADLARLERIESGGGTEQDFAEANWTLPQTLEATLARTGLPPIDLARTLVSFSGGERTRLAIARLLIDPPDLLLLDEPTNNLDDDGRSAIASLLASWRGGALVVSHDRELLESVDRIVALSPVGVSIHGGGWSSWISEREAMRDRAEADREAAERRVRAANRDAKAARERQARRDRAGHMYSASGSAPKILMGRQRERAENSGGRSRAFTEKRIETGVAELEAARTRVEVATPFNVTLPSCGLPPNRLVLTFDEVTWCTGERRVIDRLSFSLRGPERIALTGRNGAGKTTVLRLAAGLAAPDGGEIQRPLPHALLDQTVSLLDRNSTLVDNMRRLNPLLDDNSVRVALARFAFRNVAGEKLVRELSGGERLRAGLASVLSAATVPQLLMLDEPTNHLDLESIEVIESVLRGYDGALLLVSHDTSFTRAVGISRNIQL
ncbi:ATP-binding cassette domain-containing protein [Novosphingobium sp. KN65.2]|uniref:ATP-binding cassette domain-containing protein n=1 Tax=Novosphingobium sp. KN65.2 TaxID=1478134 RepID=UPI0005E3664A|nr:ATP-binding cassette domain-containing protein [Novosphingobium sp. KN65.2]CDO34950.1 putative ABC transporter, ATP-binding protein [Novosphingobium sp. KN65.2]